MAKTTPRRRGGPGRRRFTLDEALVALFIGAMSANDHVAPDEAARAHHLIWSTRRFRRKSGDWVGQLIQDMKTLVADSNPGAVIDSSARAIPARLRMPVFALVADLLLADGKLERKERAFLNRLGAALKLKDETTARIVEVVLTKNQL